MEMGQQSIADLNMHVFRLRARLHPERPSTQVQSMVLSTQLLCHAIKMYKKHFLEL